MPEVTFSKLYIAVHTVSFHAATQLGFATFNALADADGQALLITVFLMGDDVAPHIVESLPDGGTRVTHNKRSAFGVRIALKLSGAQANTKLSFGALAASNDTSVRKVALDKEARGFPPDLNILVAGIDSTLDASTLGSIRELLSKHLPEYVRGIAKQGGALSVGTIIERNPNTAEASTYSPCKAINYAYTKIAQRVPLTTALQSGWMKEADRSVVRQMYARYSAETSMEEAASKANEWILNARRRKQ